VNKVLDALSITRKVPDVLFVAPRESYCEEGLGCSVGRGVESVLLGVRSVPA